MSENKIVYLGLGGNIGDTLSVLKTTLARISAAPELQELEVSDFYETTPVSNIPQPNYLNAVCRFKTRLNPEPLFHLLQEIEKIEGKQSKPKNHPRLIDIDLLFFGLDSFSNGDLEIPHPRWMERLFVVIPLLDLTKTISVAGKNGIETLDLLKLKYSLEERHASDSVKKIFHWERTAIGNHGRSLRD